MMQMLGSFAEFERSMVRERTRAGLAAAPEIAASRWVAPPNERASTARDATVSGHRSKHVDEFQGQSFDYVLTVCDDAKESCPVFPGHAKRIHNAFEDPAALQGTEEERLALFRRVRNEIRGYLKAFPANAG